MAPVPRSLSATAVALPRLSVVRPCAKRRLAISVPRRLAPPRVWLTPRDRRNIRVANVYFSSAEEAPTSMQKVEMQVQKSVSLGQSLKVVGGHPALGDWNPAEGLALEWSEGDLWSSVVDLPAGSWEFKAVVVGGGPDQWEDGANRKVELPEGSPGVKVGVEMGFGDTSATLVVVEEEGDEVPAPEVEAGAPDALSDALEAPASDNGVSAPEASKEDTKCGNVVIRMTRGLADDQSLKVVGNHPAMGEWNCENGLLFETSGDDAWMAEVTLPPGSWEFKVVVVGGGPDQWEDGSNRTIVVPEELEGFLDVSLEFGNTSAMTVEESVAEPAMIEGSLEDEVPGAEAELPEAVNAIQSAEEPEEGVSGSSIEDEDYSSSASLEEVGSEPGLELEPEPEPEPEPEQVALLSAESNQAAEAPEDNYILAADAAKEAREWIAAWRETQATEVSSITNDFPAPADLQASAEAEPVAEPFEEPAYGDASVTEKVKAEEGEAVPVAAMAAEEAGVEEEESIGAGAWFAILLGLAAVPLVGWSEWTLYSTGCGLPPGPGGLLGAAEGISYLTVAAIAIWSVAKKASTGKGLPPGPGGLLGAVEGLSFLVILSGAGVLGYQYYDKGYIPGALPGGECFGDTPVEPLDLSAITAQLDALKASAGPVVDQALAAAQEAKESLPTQEEVKATIKTLATTAKESSEPLIAQAIAAAQELKESLPSQEEVRLAVEAMQDAILEEVEILKAASQPLLEQAVEAAKHAQDSLPTQEDIQAVLQKGAEVAEVQMQVMKASAQDAQSSALEGVETLKAASKPLLDQAVMTAKHAQDSLPTQDEIQSIVLKGAEAAEDQVAAAKASAQPLIERGLMRWQQMVKIMPTEADLISAVDSATAKSISGTARLQEAVLSAVPKVQETVSPMAAGGQDSVVDSLQDTLRNLQ